MNEDKLLLQKQTNEENFPIKTWQTSKYHKALGKNYTNDLYGLALRKGNCIFLTGSCPTPTPQVVYNELHKTFMQNNKFCSYNTGEPALKFAISKYAEEHNENIGRPSKNVLITLGATTFLQQLFLYILDEDSECIVITPTFQDYFNQLRFTRCSIVEVSMCEKENEWTLNVDDVDKVITEKTKCILLCSPNNPTGKIYSEQELTQLANIAKKHNIFLVADEAYNFLSYGKKYTSLLSLNDVGDNIIVARTFSKEFSMCGWRVGYAYVPSIIYDDLFHLQLSFNSVAATISQKAAEISLLASEIKPFIKEEIVRIKQNRDYVMSIIDRIGKGLSYIVPEACPYLFVKYNKNIDSYDLCKDIIDKSSVIVSPGIGNGQGGEGHFCITFGDDICVVTEGMKRLESYFNLYY